MWLGGEAPCRVSGFCSGRFFNMLSPYASCISHKSQHFFSPYHKMLCWCKNDLSTPQISHCMHTFTNTAKINMFVIFHLYAVSKSHVEIPLHEKNFPPERKKSMLLKYAKPLIVLKIMLGLQKARKLTEQKVCTLVTFCSSAV